MGDRRGGQLVWCNKSQIQGVMSPEVGSLEDHDKGTLVHMRKKRKLYHSDAKEGQCDSKICFQVLKHTLYESSMCII